MLRNGFISTDYRHWISVFHDGYLSENDRMFLFSITNNSPSPFTLTIDNPESVYDEFEIDYFESVSILNSIFSIF